jgi:hypothetical protein
MKKNIAIQLNIFKVDKTITFKTAFCIIFILLLRNDTNAQVKFESSNAKLNTAFDWAKNKAMSLAHDGSDPVGYWYEAALPNREAFCMRDASHQAIGASILGLNKHNLNMFQKFAANISVEKDYCSYWEINRYDKPAPVDYETDKDFWYNLPANFDVMYNAWRLYQWTGDKTYLKDTVFKKFYALSAKEYIDHWQLGSDKILTRNRSMYDGESKRFGSQRGIPTYSEGGRDRAMLGIDLTASIIAAYKSYAQILTLNGQEAEAKMFEKKSKTEQQFLNDFWWDKQRNEYKSVQYEDKSFDYSMVGDHEAFLHYLLYYNAIDDKARTSNLAKWYQKNSTNLIVEIKSYLPTIFYEYGYSDFATKMIVDLCAPENKRRDFPEIPFTTIEHITRGYMGVEVDAITNSVTTLTRQNVERDWSELKNLSLLSNTVSIKHIGTSASVFKNQSGTPLTWHACIAGNHDKIYVNGVKKKCKKVVKFDKRYSMYSVVVKQGEEIKVSTLK